MGGSELIEGAPLVPCFHITGVRSVSVVIDTLSGVSKADGLALITMLPQVGFKLEVKPYF
jgi:hypothetical protein